MSAMKASKKKVYKYLLLDFYEMIKIMKNEEKKFGDFNYFTTDYKITLEANAIAMQKSKEVQDVFKKLEEVTKPIIEEIAAIDQEYGKFNEDGNPVMCYNEDGHVKMRSILGVRMPVPDLKDASSEKEYTDKVNQVFEKNKEPLQDADKYLSEKVEISLYEFDKDSFNENSYKYIEPIMEVMVGGNIENDTGN